MPKNVYIHQINGPFSKNLLPLAGGLITSYSKSISNICNNYQFFLRILRENPLDTAMSYDNPDVIAFSTYSWNFKQSVEIARLAKEIYPEVLVVFGGPMIGYTQRPEEISSFFTKHSCVDVIVHGMGEWVFSEILQKRLSGESIESIPGLSFRRNGSWMSSLPANFRKDLNELSSPFLDGTFDELLDNYGESITGALWETNRGCPFQCTFCVQGDSAFNNILNFDTSRLNSELGWISNRKIEYMFTTDANFGIKRQDILIAEKISNFRQTTGYPKYFIVNWMKNSSKKIFQIAEVLKKGDLLNRITLSRQSFSESTLKAVKRENIKIKAYDELKEEAIRQNLMSYTEIILGLSGDTRENFLDSLNKCMSKSLNHYYVVYLCRLLDGTEMATIHDRALYQYETRTVEMGFGRYASNSENGVPETEDIIVGQKSMSIDEWKECHLMSSMTLSMYNFRLIFFICNFLKSNLHIDLLNWFMFLVKSAESNDRYPIIGKSIEIARNCEKSILDSDTPLVSVDFLDNVLLESHEAICLFLLNNKKRFYDEVWNLVNEYLATIERKVDQEILFDIFKYQMSLIPTWKDHVPSKVYFEYNIPQFFGNLLSGSDDLEIRQMATSMDVADDPILNVKDFSQKKLMFTMLKIATVKNYT